MKSAALAVAAVALSIAGLCGPVLAAPPDASSPYAAIMPNEAQLNGTGAGGEPFFAYGEDLAPAGGCVLGGCALTPQQRLYEVHNIVGTASAQLAIADGMVDGARAAGGLDLPGDPSYWLAAVRFGTAAAARDFAASYIAEDLSVESNYSPDGVVYPYFIPYPTGQGSIPGLGADGAHWVSGLWPFGRDHLGVSESVTQFSFSRGNVAVVGEAVPDSDFQWLIVLARIVDGNLLRTHFADSIVQTVPAHRLLGTALAV